MSDLTALPGAAPALRRVAAVARYELGLLVRNGEQLLLTLVIPLVLLFGLRAFSSSMGATDADVIASVVSIAVIATSFTSLAIATAFERRSSSLQLLATTPLTATNVLAGKALAIVAFEVVQLTLIVLVALALGMGPLTLLPLILGVLIGTACFSACGFFIAGVLRAEAVLAVANAVFLFFLVACGLTIRIDAFPTWWQSIASFTPATALVQVMLNADLAAVGVLLCWGVIAAIAARFTFKWT